MPSRISQFLETRTLFLGHHSPTHASVDCPQGMHQDLMFIPRKGTRRGLASRGKALVQLAALPNQDQGATNHAFFVFAFVFGLTVTYTSNAVARKEAHIVGLSVCPRSHHCCLALC